MVSVLHQYRRNIYKWCVSCQESRMTGKKRTTARTDGCHHLSRPGGTCDLPTYSLLSTCVQLGNETSSWCSWILEWNIYRVKWKGLKIGIEVFCGEWGRWRQLKTHLYGEEERSTHSRLQAPAGLLKSNVMSLCTLFLLSLSDQPSLQLPVVVILPRLQLVSNNVSASWALREIVVRSVF